MVKRRIEIFIFSFLGVIAVLSLSLFFYQFAHAGKMYRNVYAAGVDLSGLSKSQASALLSNKYNSILEEEVTLKTKNGEVVTKVKDTGLSIDLDKTTEELYKIGRNERFMVSLKDSLYTIWKKNDVKIISSVDQEKYNQFLDIAVAQLNSKPTDASIAIENGEIKSVPEKNGYEVDTSGLLNQILTLLNENSTKAIVLETKVIEPSIKETDFATATSFANSILNKKITLSHEAHTYSPTKNEMGKWITFENSDGKYAGKINDSNITAYLDRIAKDFEIPKKDRKINALDNAVIDEGREGKYLDKKDAIVKIKSGITTQTATLAITMKTYTEAPKEIKVFPAEGLIPGRFEGRYIDIDLTLQKMCQVESTNIIACHIISSGRPGMATPTGTYTIFEKNPRHYSNKYSMWLPWWQQFKAGGYGIHELPETSTWKEVPDHLGTPVSHGCVRLGVGPAESVYNWTEIGTPVYIHK